MRAYGDTWQGPLYNWSEYARVSHTPEAMQHLRTLYAATLTMVDKWLGCLLDELERQGILEDTLTILIGDPATVNRDALLRGWFGQTVNLTDRRFTYFRSPASADNQPLYHYFLTPGTFNLAAGLHNLCTKDFYQEAELGTFLPYSDYPVIRPRTLRPVSPEWKNTALCDIGQDCHQTVDLAGREIESRYERLLADTMSAVQAPAWQYQRLDLETRIGRSEQEPELTG